MNSHLLVHHHKTKQTEGPRGPVGRELLEDQADEDPVEDDQDDDEVETGEVDEVVDDPTGGLVGGPLEQAAGHDVGDGHGEDGEQGHGLDERHQLFRHQVRPREVPNYRWNKIWKTRKIKIAQLKKKKKCEWRKKKDSGTMQIGF